MLGVAWKVNRDEVVIDVKHILMEALALCHTKRNVVSIVSRVYNPLRFIAPAVIPLKIFFQELCKSKLGWDEPMTGYSQGSCSLIVSKTRVAPLLKQTLPRLELLGAVL